MGREAGGRVWREMMGGRIRKVADGRWPIGLCWGIRRRERGVREQICKREDMAGEERIGHDRRGEDMAGQTRTAS